MTKVIVSHAGGYLPYVIGRWDHAHRTRPECQDIRKPPSEYLKMLYYDSISHGTQQLQYLISMVGAERVLLGTDHPFDMGDWRPVESIGKLKGAPAADRRRILGKNAQELFKV